MKRVFYALAFCASFAVSTSFAGESREDNLTDCGGDVEVKIRCSDKDIVESLSPLELNLVEQLSKNADEYEKSELFFALKRSERCTQASILSGEDAGPDADGTVLRFV